MIDTRILREKILDLAIRGKLVPQDPNDEPASALLERIRAEKQQMVKEGKLKAKDVKDDTVIFVGEDNLHYEKFQDGTVKCIEDEIPFEVPEGWEWCRLGSISENITDGDHQPPPQTNSGIPFLVISDVVDGKLHFENTRYVSQEYYQSLSDYRKARYGDLLFTVTGSYGITIPVDTERKFCFQRHIGIIRPCIVDYHFLSMILSSDYIKILCNMLATGIAQKTVGLAVLRNFLIPLPPLSEQGHIVIAIEKIMRCLNLIVNEKNELLSIMKKIKSRILELAIRGKLVPQDPNDEPASVLLERIRAEKEELIKQGKIKLVKKESIVFKGDDNSYYDDIPNSWMVTTLNDVCWLDNGQLTESGKLPYLEAKVLRGIIKPKFQETGIFVKEGTKLILVDGENSGEVFVSQFAGYMGSTFKRLNFNKFINEDYVLRVIAFYKNLLSVSKTGSAVHHLNKNLFKTLSLNIPPLAEQNRIVVTINTYFTFLDQIAESLA